MASLSQFTPASADTASLLDWVDGLRLHVGRKLAEGRRKELGQFLTPAPVARLLADMFEPTERQSIRLLDPGAGVGSLTAAFVAAACAWKTPPLKIEAELYELDGLIVDHLSETIGVCRRACEVAGVDLRVEIHRTDFIEAAAGALRPNLLSSEAPEPFDCVILNPPYGKIRSDSRERAILERAGVTTSNLYTGFLALAASLLCEQGQMVAITPRSFCNGPYFRPFRRDFLATMRLRRLHVFETRNTAFRDDQVLQETVIFHAVKDDSEQPVVIISSAGPHDEAPMMRTVPYGEVVRPDDPGVFIRIRPDELEQQIAEQMESLHAALTDLDLMISTGRVVDFRARDWLRAEPGSGTAPLVHPMHLRRGRVVWPQPGSKKPNAIHASADTAELLVPAGTYVLVKRFSAKEENRRIVAAVLQQEDVPGNELGFENHLNYFHAHGKGLSEPLAWGLTGFLNSTLLDRYFRQFSGHTQVNATDLRSLRYPSRTSLESLGARLMDRDEPPTQAELDELVNEELFPMAEKSGGPLKAQQKLDKALYVLKALGVPKAQQNERSALTLLALLDLRPETPWEHAKRPMLGITEMMEFFAEHYGKSYAPNTRETVRRQTVHQFLQAGLVLMNPDDPARATNSPRTVYQIAPETLELLRAFGSEVWEELAKDYLVNAGALRDKYAREREMKRIPVQVRAGEAVLLSPGEHNRLTREIVEEFCPRFTPGGRVIYVGDTADKFAYYDVACLARLGVEIESHGKMPDVVVHFPEAGWLVLIEAVTSHGPIGPKRHEELKELFAGATTGLVFVTAFPDRATLNRYLGDIAWETDVWIAEAPTHLIHFDGERFLGPYDD